MTGHEIQELACLVTATVTGEAQMNGDATAHGDAVARRARCRSGTCRLWEAATDMRSRRASPWGSALACTPYLTWQA